VSISLFIRRDASAPLSVRQAAYGVNPVIFTRRTAPSRPEGELAGRRSARGHPAGRREGEGDEGGTKGESESYLHPRGRCSHEVQERQSQKRGEAGGGEGEGGKREDPESRGEGEGEDVRAGNEAEIDRPTDRPIVPVFLSGVRGREGRAAAREHARLRV